MCTYIDMYDKFPINPAGIEVNETNLVNNPGVPDHKPVRLLLCITQIYLLHP